MNATVHPAPARSDSTALRDGDALDPAIARLLAEAGDGDAAAWDTIYRLLYDDLHRIAKSEIRRLAIASHSPTSLISETWIKLARAHVPADSRAHLVALLARAMRFVLVDQARRATASKRGRDILVVASAEARAVPGDALELDQLLSIHSALQALETLDPRLAQVVELRYFAGLDEAEIASLLDVAVRTVRRDWRKARAFLQAQLDRPVGTRPGPSQPTGDRT
ncbi:ECF-type sigma factor [Luteimonas sp. TWI1416]|uniref:ECF-type sigma factor n=1 Tax=unclassified Luteimonas TaxID=2629088 RepID=UPI00320B2330